MFRDVPYRLSVLVIVRVSPSSYGIEMMQLVAMKWEHFVVQFIGFYTFGWFCKFVVEDGTWRAGSSMFLAYPREGEQQ